MPLSMYISEFIISAQANPTLSLLLVRAVKASSTQQGPIQALFISLSDHDVNDVFIAFDKLFNMGLMCYI